MKVPVIPILNTGDIHAFSTRRGDCEPEQPYSGFNVCHYTGDDPAHIDECRRELTETFGVPADRLVMPRQTHSTNVLTLTTLPVTDDMLENVDAVVTNLKGIIVGVNTADCVPVILADPTAGIAGIAHAGWRGAIGGIVEATVAAMMSLGANPADIHAAMGPSICIDCFEVGEEVATRFGNDCVRRIVGAKPHVSIHRHIVNALKASGVSGENITPFDPSLCTRCHPDEYWSARKSGINSGRIFTFVIIGRENESEDALI